MKNKLSDLANSNKLDEQFTNFSNQGKTVFTKDGVEVEKHSNKYKGHVFYHEDGQGYECLGYSPILQDCIYRNVNTGNEVIGCVKGFYWNDPTKKTLINNNSLELSNSHNLGEVFLSYDGSQHCGCGKYNYLCQAACKAKEIEAKAAKALRDAAASIKAEKDKLAAKAKKAAADAADSLNAAEKKIGDKVQKGFKDAGKKVADVTRKITFKYNPVVAIPRSSALIALRVNVFGIATRLYPALLTDAELKKGHFNIANAVKAKAAWVKISKFWSQVGGDVKILEKEIRLAHDKPVFHTKASEARKRAESNFNGEMVYSMEEHSDYTALAIAGYISAGISILSPIVNMIVQAKAAKNPYDGKEIDTTGMTTPPPPSQAELDALAAAAEADRSKGLPPDNGGQEVLLDENGKPMLDENGNPMFVTTTIWGISKPVFWTGTAILGVTAAVLILWGTGVFTKKTVK